MKEKTFEDLLDDYLMDRISPPDKSVLDEMIARDPALGREVQESIYTFQILKDAYTIRLRERLRAYDRLSVPDPSFRWKKTLGISMLSITAILFSWLLAIEYFDHQSLAKRNAEWMGGQELKSMHVNERETELWKTASDAFKQNEFAIARDGFLELSRNATGTMHEASEWNALMCHFARQGRDEIFEMKFQDYLNADKNPYHDKAVRLEQLMKNPAYKIFIQRSQTGISSLKPRLM